MDDLIGPYYWDDLWEKLAEAHPDWDEYDIDGHIRTEYIRCSDGQWIIAP